MAAVAAFSVVIGFEREEELMSVMGNGCDFVVCGHWELVTHLETQCASVQIHTPKYAGPGGQKKTLMKTQWNAKEPALDKADVAGLFAEYSTVWLLCGEGWFWLRGWDARWPGHWRDGHQCWRGVGVFGASGPRERRAGWLQEAGTDACEAGSAPRLPMLDLSEVLTLASAAGEAAAAGELTVATVSGSSNWVMAGAGREWLSWRNAANLHTAQSCVRFSFPMGLAQRLVGLIDWAHCDRGASLLCRVGVRGSGLARITSRAIDCAKCAAGAAPRAVDILLAI